jgi:type IV pilus assembly protein PilA
MDKRKNAFTLLEVIIVAVIIGILVGIALPAYRKSKESALDKEARVNLRLIQAAERIYNMEHNFYYPYNTSTSVITDINSYLKLQLPNPATLNWSYNVSSLLTNANKSTMSAARTTPSRTWTLNLNDENDPTCFPCNY